MKIIKGREKNISGIIRIVCAATKKSQAARKNLLPGFWRYIRFAAALLCNGGRMLLHPYAAALWRMYSYSVNAASSAARIMASRSASEGWADAVSPAGFAARERRRRRGFPVAASVS